MLHSPKWNGWKQKIKVWLWFKWVQMILLCSKAANFQVPCYFFCGVIKTCLKCWNLSMWFFFRNRPKVHGRCCWSMTLKEFHFLGSRLAFVGNISRVVLRILMIPVLHKWPPFILYFPHYWFRQVLLDLWILPSSGEGSLLEKERGTTWMFFGPNGFQQTVAALEGKWWDHHFDASPTSKLKQIQSEMADQKSPFLQLATSFCFH